MSATVIVHGEFDPVRIACDKGEDAIWIRTPNESIGISLTLPQLDALESAIATARAALQVAA